MDAEELAFSGIARQAELIRGGDVSSRELVDLYLDRIERLNPRLNAFTDVFDGAARAEADAADERRSAGEDAPLLGVPVAIKDIVDVEGVVTQFGTRAFDRPAAGDGEMVARLRRAGAVILAKTTLPELAICGFTESKGWGATRNPWNTDRSPGGSSGGSAAAVAAGLVGGASASDGGGSIRIPAAFCGLFGLKPQRGRIPLEPPDHWNGMSVNGCVTRTVADTALYFDVVADGGETVLRQAAAAPPGRLRIAISDKPARAILPPIVTDEVKSALTETEGLLRSLGHDVRRHDPSFGMRGKQLRRPVPDRDPRGSLPVPHPERLEARTRGFGRLGALYPPFAVRRANRLASADAEASIEAGATSTSWSRPRSANRRSRSVAGRGRERSDRARDEPDLLLHPDLEPHRPAGRRCAPGFTDDGLPLSVTLVGHPNAEPLLLSLAAQIESERPWADRRPPGFG